MMRDQLSDELKRWGIKPDIGPTTARLLGEIEDVKSTISDWLNLYNFESSMTINIVNRQANDFS